MDQDCCCPPFDPAGWDGKIFQWQNKRFLHARVFSLFYVPLNFGGVMKTLGQQVRRAGGLIPDNLCLSDHTSKWNMDVYLAVDKEIPGADNVTMSGSFLTKVYEGPFKETGRWCRDFAAYAQSRNLALRKMYMWYTTCPKCAKKYGKNYVVIAAQTE